MKRGFLSINKLIRIFLLEKLFNAHACNDASININNVKISCQNVVFSCTTQAVTNVFTILSNKQIDNGILSFCVNYFWHSYNFIIV